VGTGAAATGPTVPVGTGTEATWDPEETGAAGDPEETGAAGDPEETGAAAGDPELIYHAKLLQHMRMTRTTTAIIMYFLVEDGAGIEFDIILLLFIFC